MVDTSVDAVADAVVHFASGSDKLTPADEATSIEWLLPSRAGTAALRM